MQYYCAAMTALAILAWPWPKSASRLCCERAAPSARHAAQSNLASRADPRIGIAQALTAIIARMNSGGTLIAACEEVYGSCFATRKLTATRLLKLFESVRLPDETHRQVVRASQGVYAAEQVSERLGCRVSPCLEVVLAAYRQMRLLQQAQSQALAVPKATVGLLSALPAITVALGELMGAHPVDFLLGSAAGWGCLAVGGCCYAVGLMWVRALMQERS